MKRFYVILISLIIAVSLAVIIIVLIEPYRVKRHNRLAGPLFKDAARIYENERYASALEKYKKIVDDYYKSKYVFNALQKTADIYGRYHRRQQQVKYLEKFVENYPDKKGSAPYIYELANITFMFKNEPDKALEYYNMVINNFSDSDWADKARQRTTDIAIQHLSPEQALAAIDKVIAATESERRKDFLFLKKMEMLQKEGRLREAYEVTAEISRPLKNFVRDNLLFNQILVRYEPTCENLQSLGRVYDLRGFPRKAGEVRKRAQSLREEKGR